MDQQSQDGGHTRTQSVDRLVSLSDQYTTGQEECELCQSMKPVKRVYSMFVCIDCNRKYLP